MKLQIEHEGKVFDFSKASFDVTLTSTWRFGAAKLSFKFLKTAFAGSVSNGSYLTFDYSNEKMFAGRIFSVESTEENAVEVIAYDQLRYLKNKDTMMRKNMSLSDQLNVVASLQQLRIGNVANTQIKLGDYLHDNQTYLDMFYKSINDNLLANGYLYHIHDNYGAIELTDILDMRLPLMLGDRSGISKYSFKRSIDEDTYNQIKMSKDNKNTGQRDAYIIKDSGNIEKYGILQYYEKVNENMNDAQIKERAERLIKLKNRETETFKIQECLGDARIKGGSGIKLQLAGEGIDTWTIVDKVIHKFGSVHEMTMDLIFEKG